MFSAKKKNLIDKLTLVIRGVKLYKKDKNYYKKIIKNLLYSRDYIHKIEIPLGKDGTLRGLIFIKFKNYKYCKKALWFLNNRIIREIDKKNKLIVKYAIKINKNVENKSLKYIPQIFRNNETNKEENIQEIKKQYEELENKSLKYIPQIFRNNETNKEEIRVENNETNKEEIKKQYIISDGKQITDINNWLLRNKQLLTEPISNKSSLEVLKRFIFNI